MKSASGCKSIEMVPATSSGVVVRRMGFRFLVFSIHLSHPSDSSGTSPFNHLAGPGIGGFGAGVAAASSPLEGASWRGGVSSPAGPWWYRVPESA